MKSWIMTKKTKTNRQLTILQQAALDALLSGTAKNPTEAARIAGYSGNNNTLKQRGHELVTNSNFKAKLDAKRAELAEKMEINAERVIKEMAKCGFSNIQEFIDKGNDIKDLKDLPAEIAAAVESIQVDIRHDSAGKGYTEKVKLKLHSKLSALNDLGKHLGLFEAHNKQLGESLADFLKDL